MGKIDIQSNSAGKPEQGNGTNFFSSGLRQKIDQLMNILWAGGVNNPMDSIEQLSYLIFLRLLSERDEQGALIEKGYIRIFLMTGLDLPGTTSLLLPGTNYSIPCVQLLRDSTNCLV